MPAGDPAEQSSSASQRKPVNMIYDPAMSIGKEAGCHIIMHPPEDSRGGTAFSCTSTG